MGLDPAPGNTRGARTVTSSTRVEVGAGRAGGKDNERVSAGARNQRSALILRNHGALVVGKTVSEAFNWAHRLELARRTRLADMACNSPLCDVAQPIVEATGTTNSAGTRRPYGLMEWPALPAQARTHRSFLPQLAALVLSTCAVVCAAQDYPSRPVRVIVAFTAGGTTDVLARSIGAQLAECGSGSRSWSTTGRVPGAISAPRWRCVRRRTATP